MSGGNRFVWPNSFSVDGAGVPRAGAQLFFYETGTSTPQDTYSDPGLTTANPNPVVADSLGQFGNVFLLASPDYKVVLEDAAGNQIWTADPVSFSVAASGAVPVGGMMAYGGSAAPAGWLLCYGQAVSRTSYSALYAAIGTTYGAGDGSTTFNVPDRRGRVSIGKDDMGGVAANRVTSAVSGIDGLTLGAVGGDQNLETHNHTVTDPGHTHDLTDPGHDHEETVGQSFSGTATAWNIIGSVGTQTNIGLNTDSATTGVTIAGALTGISIGDAGSGGSQNMPPGQIDNVIIYAGV